IPPPVSNQTARPSRTPNHTDISAASTPAPCHESHRNPKTSHHSPARAAPLQSTTHAPPGSTAHTRSPSRPALPPAPCPPSPPPGHPASAENTPPPAHPGCYKYRSHPSSPDAQTPSHSAPPPDPIAVSACSS